VFLLDILSHRMSEMAMLRQLRQSPRVMQNARGVLNFEFRGEPEFR
jgi:hypothetical protein